MHFDAEDALAEGWKRLTTQVGLVVVGLYAVVSLLQNAASQDISRELVLELREYARDELNQEEYQEVVDATDPTLNELPLALGLDLGPAILVFLGAMALSLVVVALAIDAFARRATTTDDLSGSRLLYNVLNLLVGSIAFGVVVMVGLLLLVLPGLVALVLFMFYPVAIVVEEENFVSAFGSSLSTVTDNVGPTLILVVAAIVVGVVTSVVSMVFSMAIGGTVGGVLSTAVSAIGTVFLLAVLTRAYVAAHSDAPGGMADESQTAV